MFKLIDKYVKPHEVISRDVTEKDLSRIKTDSDILYKLCFKQVGIFSGGLAVAHQQITKKDPLKMFVINTGEIIVNPKIIRHTGHTIDSKEGCLSFPKNPEIIVQRWHKCEVEYQKFEDGKLSDKIITNLAGKKAYIFQHEIDHFNCNYIF